MKAKLSWTDDLRRCSLAFGTPPQIDADQYDVPKPSVQDICGVDASRTCQAAATMHICFLDLTAILARCLKHVFRLPEHKHDWKQLDALYRYREQAIEQSRSTHVAHNDGSNLPGAANFRLAQLGLKLLLDRLSSERAKDNTASRAAQDIVHFVEALNEQQICGFWLPAHTFTVMSATTFLIRTAMNGENNIAARQEALDLAKAMIQSLRSHREQHAWDLADQCLEKCAPVIEAMVIEVPEDNQDSAETTSDAFPAFLDTDFALIDDLFYSYDAFPLMDFDIEAATPNQA